MTVTDEKKLLLALGMCARARAITVGTDMICEALRKGGAQAPRLAVVASGIADNTKKRITDRCAYYGIPLVTLTCDAETLGKAVGRSAALAAVAVPEGNLLRLVEKYLRDDEGDLE